MAAMLTKLNKVSDSFSVNRYDNGFMFEVSGRDSDNDWKSAKILCNTEAELLAVIQEYNQMDLDN